MVTDDHYGRWKYVLANININYSIIRFLGFT